MTEILSSRSEWVRTKHRERDRGCRWETAWPQSRAWSEALCTRRRALSRVRSQPVAIDRAIEDSAWIVDLPPDWDGEGATRYERSTWERATAFLRNLASMFRRMFGGEMPVPRILPSAGGSIDLHWKTDRFELLVNIPSQPSGEIRYYGDNLAENMPIEHGGTQTDPALKLVAWMSLFV